MELSKPEKWTNGQRATPTKPAKLNSKGKPVERTNPHFHFLPHVIDTDTRLYP